MSSTPIYDSLLREEAEDFLYAQTSYLQAASLTGFPSSGLGSLGGGLLAQSQTLGVQTLANQANQANQYTAQQVALTRQCAGNLTSGTGVATNTYPIGTIIQSGTGVFQVAMSSNNLATVWQPVPQPPPVPPKEYFYNLLDRLERPGEWPYDDPIMAMLDKRKFEVGKVSLLAFVSFCLVNRVAAHDIAWNADTLEKLFGTFFEE